MILLTGASGGIGNFLFKEMSKKEFVIGLVNKSKLEQIDNSKVKKLNLTSEQEIKEFIIDNKLLFKNITLIHMATKSLDGLLSNYDINDLRETFEINVFANFTLTKHILPLMISQRWGRIIHVSSVVSEGTIGAGAYASSKSALIGYSKTLAKEYGRFNITSNIIRLGYFDKGLIETLSNENIKEITNKIPSKKLGKVKEILDLIKYIQTSSYMNGSVLNLNGG